MTNKPIAEDAPGIWWRVGWHWAWPSTEREDLTVLDLRIEDRVPKLRLFPFYVIRRTEHGVWVSESRVYVGNSKCLNERFVLYGTGRRYCYPTVALALDSFIQRRKKYLARLVQDVEVSRELLAQTVLPDTFVDLTQKAHEVMLENSNASA